MRLWDNPGKCQGLTHSLGCGGFSLVTGLSLSITASHSRVEPGSCRHTGKFGRWKEEEEGRKGGWTADGWKLNDGGMMSAWPARVWMNGGEMAACVESIREFLHI